VRTPGGKRWWETFVGGRIRAGTVATPLQGNLRGQAPTLAAITQFMVSTKGRRSADEGNPLMRS